MQEFMITLLTCSVSMSAVALFYMAITSLLAKRYSTRGQYYAWLIIVIGLIIPFRPQWDNALIKVTVPTATEPVFQIGSANVEILPKMNIVASDLPSRLMISWWHVAASVWFAGMLVTIAYHIIKHYRFMKTARRWSENITNEQALSLLQGLKMEMGISQQIDLYLCPPIGSPMLVGFIKPRILLSLKDLELDEFRFILKHELVHFKRKDLYYKCAVMLATCIHWFNPIVYMIAKVIDAACEISCDDEIVYSTGVETRRHYSETIIGAARYQSKLKTALSTNFYGGKKGMKRRIYSIMDMGKKKTGAAIICVALVATVGTGITFAANNNLSRQPASTDESISTSIQTALSFDFDYFQTPNPDIYDFYTSYGVTISEDGMNLIYNGQKVRMFVDEHSDWYMAPMAFYLNRDGVLDISVIRDSYGNITGIENLSEKQAQKFFDIFFSDEKLAKEEESLRLLEEKAQELRSEFIVTGNVSPNKYLQYFSYGVMCSEDNETLLYNGQIVRLLVDKPYDFNGGNYTAFWEDENGTVDLSVIRNSSGEITGIEIISDEEANELRAELKSYQQKNEEYFNSEEFSKKVEADVAEKMRQKFGE